LIFFRLKEGVNLGNLGNLRKCVATQIGNLLGSGIGNAGAKEYSGIKDLGNKGIHR